ncbi:hypothetical protein ACP6PL_21365 [Dapis sp. BLCC M126]|uniref:hypothetical protein n=1 Tax=Dapis sp. BLCC M126 TaxID=3400189 RepID=UPI003CEF84D3
MMRRLISLFLVVIFWLSTPSVSFAQNNINNLDNLPLEKVQELISIRHSITTIDELEKRGVLSETQATTETKYYLEKSQIIVGEKLNLEQIIRLTNNYEIVTPGSQTNIIQKIAGFVTFTNIILTAAAILLVLALASLASLYLIPILTLIPDWGYEIIIYLVCLAAIVGGNFVTGIGEFIAFPGCLGLIGAISFSHYLHRKFFQKLVDDKNSYPYYLDSFILFIIWAIAAIVYKSSLLGFITIIALETCLGFSVIITPLRYMIGFAEKDVIPRAMSASLILLTIYVSAEVTNVELPYMGIFSTGVLFVGSFVYFVGTLIVSSKWYEYGNFNINRYLWLQFLTIVSGIIALYIGSVWQVLLLQRIGGTFFFLYLIEKYFELPWQQKSWSWATLGLAVILYLSALVAKQYPEYFFLVN